MSETSGPFPRSWKEAIPYVVWIVLVLGFGLEFVTAVVHFDWRPAVISFVGLVGLMAMAIHWRAIHRWMPVMGAGMVLLTIVALSPYGIEFGIPNWAQIAAPIITVGIGLYVAFSRRASSTIPVTTQNAAEILVAEDIYYAYQETATYKDKIFLVLRNVSGKEITVRAPRWIRSKGGFNLQKLDDPKWNHEGSGDWHIGSWSPEINDPIVVKPDRVIQTWTGISNHLASPHHGEIRRRLLAKQIATFMVTIAIEGKEVTEEKHL